MTHASSPVPLPRALIFLASLWLIGSWFLAIGVRPPIQPSASSYEPGVRLMLLCVTTGLMIGWPLLRLSQSPTPTPLRQTLLDLAVLLAMMQVVIWLLRLVTTWPPIRTLAIDATLAGWAMLAGAIVASAIGSTRGGPRSLAMLACLGLCLLAPALAVLGVMSGVESMALIELSPLLAVRSLGEGGRTPLTFAEWRWIGLLWSAALTVWLVLAGSLALARRGGETQA
ncbi:MAG: hypothetical protein SYC29_05580 [Planctomycetota bacterium]|nr:hypothetical protein [Planctomycetota bacterium]